jgi:hypothetical protein
MKKSEITRDGSSAGPNIDEYCHSVEELLKTINNRPGTKAKEETYEEPRFMDHDEDMFEYQEK